MKEATWVKVYILAVVMVMLGTLVTCSTVLHYKRAIPEIGNTSVRVLPTFKRGDCFDFNDEKELWEKSPDGIIERVGKASYLILFREAAEKRGGSKFASTMSVATFDKYHHKVECPETWIKHTHTEDRGNT